MEKNADRTLLITRQHQNGEGAAVTENAKSNSDMGGAGACKENTPLKVANREVTDDSLMWTQNQQKIFEWGLAQFPKGVEDRWGT